MKHIAILLLSALAVPAAPLVAADFLDEVDLQANHPFELHSDLGAASGYVDLERDGATIKVTYHPAPGHLVSGYWQANVNGASVDMFLACLNVGNHGLIDSIHGGGSARGTGKGMRLEVAWQYDHSSCPMFGGRSITHSIREVITLIPRNQEREGAAAPPEDSPPARPEARGDAWEEGEAPHDPHRCAWEFYYGGALCRTAPSRGAERGCRCPEERWRNEDYFLNGRAVADEIGRLAEGFQKDSLALSDQMLLLQFLSDVRTPYVEAVKGFRSNVDGRVLTPVQKAREALFESWEKLREDARRAWERVMESIRSVGSDLRDLFENIAKNAKKIADFDLSLNPLKLAGEVWDTLVALKDLVADGIADLAETGRAAVEAIVEAHRALAEVLASLLERIGETLAIVTETFVEIVDGLVQTVSDVVALIRDIHSSVDNAWDRLTYDETSRLKKYGLDKSVLVPKGFTPAIEKVEGLLVLPATLPWNEKLEGLTKIRGPLSALLEVVRIMESGIQRVFNAFREVSQEEILERLLELARLRDLPAPDPRGGSYEVGRLQRALEHLGLEESANDSAPAPRSPCERKRAEKVDKLRKSLALLADAETGLIADHLAITEADLPDLADAMRLSEIDLGITPLTLELSAAGLLSDFLGVGLDVFGAIAGGGTPVQDIVGLVNGVLGTCVDLASFALSLYDATASIGGALVAAQSLEGTIQKFQSAAVPIYEQRRRFLHDMTTSDVADWMTPACSR